MLAKSPPPTRANPVPASSRWRARFEARQPELRSRNLGGDVSFPPGLETEVRRSLPIFQLGETGTGSHLRRAAAATGDLDYLRAMELFVAEEGEHARMLALILESLDEPLRTRDWTDSFFVRVRHINDIRFQVLIVLVAEIIGKNYYRSIAQSGASPAIRELLGAIHADEDVHLAFHHETLPAFIDRWNGASRRLVWSGWTLGVLLAGMVMATQHRALLKATGSGVAPYLRGVWVDASASGAALFGSERRVNAVSARVAAASYPRSHEGVAL